MSGLRFKQGELAILVVARGKKSSAALGDQVLIHAVGPFRRGDTFHPYRPGSDISKAMQDVDYAVIAPTGGIMCMDWQLRKIDPPAELESITRRLEVGEEVA